MTPLYGHDEAVSRFLAEVETGRFHHAWLLTGPEGIGKTLFAEKAALHFLAQGAGPAVGATTLDVPDDHRIARLFEAGSHPDFIRLERLPAEEAERKKPRAEWFGTAQLARGIKVDQVREILRLLGTQPAFSNRRVVVIEPADVLEVQAANALLKSLEEPPPNTLFLLVSHSPAQLFATIRSRCQIVRFSPLDDDTMTSVLSAAVPDAAAGEIESLVRIGAGSPGRALSARGLDIEGLDREMDMLVRQGDPTNARRSALAQSLSLKSAQDRYEAFLARAPSRIAAAAKTRSGQARADAIRLWERATGLAGSARRHSLDPTSVVFELAGLLAALAEGEGRDAA